MTAGDLDDDTKKRIESGRRYTELLKQDQHATMPFQKQVISIFAANTGILDGAPVSQVRVIERELLAFIERDRASLEKRIETERAISDETSAELTQVIEEFKKTHAHLYA